MSTEKTGIMDLTGFVAIPKTEYDQLLAAKVQLDEFTRLLSMSKSPNGVATAPPPVADTSESPTEPSAPIGRRPRKVKKTYDDLSDKEKIEWALKALELRQFQGGAWKNGSWEKLLKTDFGYHNSDLGSSLRAALARTGGSFRSQYEVRIQKVFGVDAAPLLERLTKIPV